LTVVRLDLHVHTSASFDCLVAPARMLARARRVGLTAVAITDHDTLDGARSLSGLRPGAFIPGEEVATRDGELIGLFLSEAITSGLHAKEAVRRIKDQGGLVYLEHPYDSRRRCLSEDAIELLADSIDIVEVFNGRSTTDANHRAGDLCATLGAAPGAGSDAHTVEELGSCYVEIEPFATAQGFLSNLRQGKVVRHPNRLRLMAAGGLARLTRRT
jgi:predicted metal-dependent phosphoesterase TrpH